MYQYILPSDIGETFAPHFPISGISSAKILRLYFKEKLAIPEDNIDDLIVFYKTLSKIIGNLTPEQCMEMYFTMKGSDKNGNYLWNYGNVHIT